MLAEGWQLHQIAVWHQFKRLAGFAPSGQASGNYERTESLLPQ
jgi:hypothetical protein